MLIIYNPEKNLFVLTILRLAMLINIGVLEVSGKRGGFLIFGEVNCICANRKKIARIFNCTGRQKDITKTWTTH